jgi:hypothetical protein
LEEGKLVDSASTWTLVLRKENETGIRSGQTVTRFDRTEKRLTDPKHDEDNVHHSIVIQMVGDYLKGNKLVLEWMWKELGMLTLENCDDGCVGYFCERVDGHQRRPVDPQSTKDSNRHGLWEGIDCLRKEPKRNLPSIREPFLSMA